jgi:O-antigen ligase
MFQEHPLFGVGFGRYAHTVNLFVVPEWFKAAHNVFMSTLAETGIVGITILLSMYWYVIHNILVANKHAKSIQEKTAAIYVLAIVFGFNIINAIFHGSHISRMMFFVFALGVIVKRLVIDVDESAIEMDITMRKKVEV